MLGFFIGMKKLIVDFALTLIGAEINAKFDWVILINGNYVFFFHINKYIH